jgi:hypothetical protein
MPFTPPQRRGHVSKKTIQPFVQRVCFFGNHTLKLNQKKMVSILNLVLLGDYPFTFAVATFVTPVSESAANPAWLAVAGVFVVWRGRRAFLPTSA